MGKFKDIFVTCLGLGMVAGAGYYLYRKYVSRNSEENSSASQVIAEDCIRNPNISERKFESDVLPIEVKSKIVKLR